MAWYWWLGICVYCSIGFWIGGWWFGDEREQQTKLLAFIFSIFIAVFFPFVIIISIIIAIWDNIKIYLNKLNVVRKIHNFIKRKKEIRELNKNYENDRLERMGVDEKYWKVD